jgi:hypothetical protein
VRNGIGMDVNLKLTLKASIRKWGLSVQNVLKFSLPERT